MSQTLLAEYAFKALRNEVERKSSSPEGQEYELVTNLILRGSTALAPSSTLELKSPPLVTPRRVAGRSTKNP